MTEQTLSIPAKLPESHQNTYELMEELTRRIANRILERYWSERHLTGINEYDGKHAWKYFNESEAFKGFDFYPPSRFKRCILQKVGETLRSQAVMLKTFRAIEPLLPKGTVSKSDEKQIKKKSL